MIMPTPARPLLLSLQGSPRRRGSTARLAAAFARSLPDCRTRTIHLFQEHILPCRGCITCKNRPCPLPDSVSRLQAELERADALLLSAPVFFYGFPSHVKALIDRTLPWWYHPPQRLKRPAFFLATCGSNRAREFEVIVREAKSFLNTAGFEMTGHLLVPGLEGRQRSLLLRKAQTHASEAARRWARSWHGHD